MKFSRQHIATFLAILFHVSGLIGILATPYKDWFIRNTPLNLCLMSLLVIWCQEDKRLSFFAFLVIVYVAGMGVEMIGVSTGFLFGEYAYGNVLGAKTRNVPWLIGLNWFLVIFCSAAVMQKLHDWFNRKIQDTEAEISPRIEMLSFIIDGALLATFFDWVMEPVAGKLGFWYWKNHEVPGYNYLCWFIISALLLALLRRMKFSKANHFAVHLLIIQLLFFFSLRTFLV